MVDGNANPRRGGADSDLRGGSADQLSQRTLTPSQTAALAPVSTVSIATATDPIPRFVATTPVSDCTAHSDCNSFYFPHLFVDTTPINLTGSSLGAPQSAIVPIANTGAGTLNFTTSVAYQSGSGWLSVLPSSSSGNERERPSR